MNDFHKPVLLKEVLGFLSVVPGKKYIDATIGGGGYAVEILKLGGKVLGVDLDQDAINYIKENIKVREELILVNGNFKNIEEIAHLNGFEGVDGIIFDLGVSSHQLESSERGFSFQKEGPLDMRMSKEFSVKAADLINGLTKGELYELFTKLGEERFARTISNSIIRARRMKPIETTGGLASIVIRTYGSKIKLGTPKAFALANMRVFQALRIAVNDELNSLRIALPGALKLLKKEGRLLVISFHSLEDRIVKQSFNEFQKEGFGRALTKKPIGASFDEVENSIKSRSAKLRVFEVNN